MIIKVWLFKIQNTTKTATCKNSNATHLFLFQRKTTLARALLLTTEVAIKKKNNNNKNREDARGKRGAPSRRLSTSNSDYWR